MSKKKQDNICFLITWLMNFANILIGVNGLKQGRSVYLLFCIVGAILILRLNKKYEEQINAANILLSIILTVASIMLNKGVLNFMVEGLALIATIIICLIVFRKRFIIAKYKLLNRIYKLLCGKMSNFKHTYKFRKLRDKLKKYEKIVDSIAFNYKETTIKEPCLVLAKDLGANWKNKAFSVKLVRGDHIKVIKRLEGDTPRFDLKVNTAKSKYGIYSNTGKRYLISQNKDHYYNAEKDVSKVNSCIINDRNSFKEESFTLNQNNYYRWISGGVIPIVKYKQKKWFVLGFRGIKPIGWNIANGSIEDKEDSLQTTILREFFEEILITDNPYENNQVVKTRPFSLKGEQQDRRNEEIIKSSDFSEKHLDKREKQDKLQFDGVKEDARIMKIPFNYNVYEEGNKKNMELENSIFIINPYEQGIEYISAYEFYMEDNEYLLFGEILEDRDCLAREPIMLLSCDYVKDIYDKTKSFGDKLEKKKNNKDLGCSYAAKEENYYDCRVLNFKIPEEHYHIFGYDIEQKYKIIQNLSERKASGEKINEKELEFQKNWVNNYGGFFQYNSDKKSYSLKYDVTQGDKINPVMSFCPVTWKILETMCSTNRKKI